MPFREKKAWATIFALLVVFIPYYYLMMRLYHQPDPNYNNLGQLALLALITFIALETILVVAAHRLSPEDAGIPKDEREQLFAFRSARIAYAGLIFFVIATTFPMIHWSGGNWGWGMLYLAAIILAEVLRASALIFQYRQDY